MSGKKGNGKSLVVVGRIKEALLRGLPVATNLDLNLEHLLPVHCRNVRVIRLPDFPSKEDLETIGAANPESEDGIIDESRNGLLVLDELAVFLNARTFQDKRRAGFLEWFVHSRKLGWDTYLICQHPNQIDKQIREGMAEYHVICRRLDKLKVPFLPIKMPRIHIGFVRYGMERDSVMAERWVVRGTPLFRAYNTRQRFRADYASGPFSLLPPWNLEGWRTPLPMWKRALHIAPKVPLVSPVTVTQKKTAAVRPKHELVTLLERLPPDERVRHWRRLEQAGAF